mmetsp:Transcript_113411/g.242027  ORF Transcript_113411/g.242027 Transcript_113411/m.242027 type:complete len:251 (+) Transcript_113411:776-1528(+)
MPVLERFTWLRLRDPPSAVCLANSARTLALVSVILLWDMSNCSRPKSAQGDSSSRSSPVRKPRNQQARMRGDNSRVLVTAAESRRCCIASTTATAPSSPKRLRARLRCRSLVLSESPADTAFNARSPSSFPSKLSMANLRPPPARSCATRFPSRNLLPAKSTSRSAGTESVARAPSRSWSPESRKSLLAILSVTSSGHLGKVLARASAGKWNFRSRFPPLRARPLRARCCTGVASEPRLTASPLEAMPEL